MMSREETILGLRHQVELLAAMRLKKLPPGRVAYDDLVQEAWIGAIAAVDGFDHGKLCTLATFADRKIRGAMSQYLRDQDHLTRNHRRDIRAGKEREVRTVAIEALPRDPRDPRMDPSAGVARIDVDALFRRAALPDRSRRVLERRADGDIGAVVAIDEGLHESRISQIYHDGLRKMAKAAGFAA